MKRRSVAFGYNQKDRDAQGSGRKALDSMVFLRLLILATPTVATFGPVFKREFPNWKACPFAAKNFHKRPEFQEPCRSMSRTRSPETGGPHGVASRVLGHPEWTAAGSTVQTSTGSKSDFSKNIVIETDADARRTRLWGRLFFGAPVCSSSWRMPSA